ncbi:MAG: hypothetical protein ACJAXT_000123 [Paracoccaceae bacterium]|jgi:hypothetical protein
MWCDDQTKQESKMSKSIKAVLALGFVLTAAACGGAPQQEEIIIVEPAPIVQEPVYNKLN